MNEYATQQVNVPPGFGPPFEWENDGERFIVYRAGFVIKGEESISLFAFSTRERPRVFEVVTEEEIDESFGVGAAESVQAASRKLANVRPPLIQALRPFWMA